MGRPGVPLEDFISVAMYALGMVIGAALTYWFLRTTRGKDDLAEITEANQRAAVAERQLRESQAELALLREERVESARRISQLETEAVAEAKRLEEQQAMLALAQEKLADSFKALSSDALKANNEQFLVLAKKEFEVQQEAAKGDLELRREKIEEMIKPISESLKKVGEEVEKAERNRIESAAAFSQQIMTLSAAQVGLERETGKLANALTRPTVRGRWGEIQLKRVVELSGMSAHCDFEEQVVQNVEGGLQRPDMIINLPEGRTIVIDSKAPMNAYLEAMEATDEAAREARMKAHSEAIRNHVRELSSRRYQDNLDRTVEFVILFIPGEAFFSAAVERDLELIEFGARNKVVLATPITLIALLKVVAQSWSQQGIEENARRISEISQELYDRVCVLANHLANVGKAIGKSVDEYNKAVGSFNNRVIPYHRNVKELNGLTGDGDQEIGEVERAPRPVRGTEG